MDKPILHKIIDPNYLQFLKETYPPSKTTAGEDYESQLTYITFEKSFLTSPIELELLGEKGFSPFGFLLALRVEMSKSLGYGISLDNNSLAKIFYGIHLDSHVPLEEIESLYNILLKYGLLFIISDNDGHKVVTTTNQLYNWELKEYTKWYNKDRKRKYRQKAKENFGESTIEYETDEEQIGAVDEEIPEIETVPDEPSFELKNENSDDPFSW